MKRRETLLNNSRKRTGIAFKLPFVIQEVFRLFSLADAHLFCKANRDICTVSVSLLTPSWLFCYLLRKLQTPPGICSPEAEDNLCGDFLKVLCQMTKINRGSSVYFVQDPEEVYTL